jgi:hypothetical protein
MYVSTLIPQEIDSTPARIETWRQAHAGLVWLVDGVNLHRMYSQPWFASVIMFASLALGVSSCDQLAVARKRLFSVDIGPGEEVAESVTGQQFNSVAGFHRYRPLRTGTSEHLKCVKNPWGYFGVLTLHIGMTLVLLVSLLVSLTGRQGVLILVEGELRDNRQQLDASEHGILSSPLNLPGSIRLDRVSVHFDNKNQPADVSSDILITGQPGLPESFTASVNRISRYHGLRVYHASQYGDAFTVTFTGKSGVSHTERILVQQSTGLTKAGYSDDFSVAWSPYLFGAKYFPDADRKSMQSANPELVMRMLDGKREIGRTSVTKNIPGELGEYRVKIDEVKKWSKLILVDITGMSAIFAGFAIIMAGGLIHYMTPPRELIGVKRPDGAYRVYWKAVAFKEFYGDERDDIARELNGEMKS